MESGKFQKNFKVWLRLSIKGTKLGTSIESREETSLSFPAWY